MKHINLIIILLTVTLFSCKQSENKTESETIILAIPSKTTNDSLELQNLTRALYKWNETKSSQADFDPIQIEKTDSVYTKLDLDSHKKRLKELSETNLFSEQFIENYDKIALTIDEKMLNKTIVWNIGELPSFGFDANPWCNCQDNPDNYWEILTIKKLAIKENKASFVWTWGDDFQYKTKAIKENNVWKIAYLEGFDFNEFIK
ncbi:ribonuclease HI [Flavobacterium arsenatis]|uniref:Ribonuclease HI n=1 Tax=Flavobacterium arsenatis TaxID=1484332 RepID=A0ABU1TUU4_9FLAO|nr:hypothetical protein [Flavobacterium arsenatis]MDR6969625.1 ribonuclease HI [Flavobacterium arsenatis]